MRYSDEARRILIECDIPAAREFWAAVQTKFPQPIDDHETLIMIHSARTQAATIPLRLRVYSHHWLIERGLPSALPDYLKPVAERMYPRIVDAVGISVNVGSSHREFGEYVRTEMESAVLDAINSGVTDPDEVRRLMMLARADAWTKL